MRTDGFNDTEEAQGGEEAQTNCEGLRVDSLVIVGVVPDGFREGWIVARMEELVVMAQCPIV